MGWDIGQRGSHVGNDTPRELRHDSNGLDSGQWWVR